MLATTEGGNHLHAVRGCLMTDKSNIIFCIVCYFFMQDTICYSINLRLELLDKKLKLTSIFWSMIPGNFVSLIMLSYQVVLNALS